FTMLLIKCYNLRQFSISHQYNDGSIRTNRRHEVVRQPPICRGSGNNPEAFTDSAICQRYLLQSCQSHRRGYTRYNGCGNIKLSHMIKLLSTTSEDKRVSSF